MDEFNQMMNKSMITSIIAVITFFIIFGAIVSGTETFQSKLKNINSTITMDSSDTDDTHLFDYLNNYQRDTVNEITDAFTNLIYSDDIDIEAYEDRLSEYGIRE